MYYSPDLDVRVLDWPTWLKFPEGCYKPNPDLSLVDRAKASVLVYPEHNDQYLRECLDNLANKGIEIPL